MYHITRVHTSSNRAARTLVLVLRHQSYISTRHIGDPTARTYIRVLHLSLSICGDVAIALRSIAAHVLRLVLCMQHGWQRRRR